MAEHQQSALPADSGRTRRISTAANLVGGAVSLALIIGMGVWGYKLIVRDVSGVPVVRAVEGPLRVQPDDPGGRPALNQGLAVNDVAAEGTAADPADRLILAPEPLDLSIEDAASLTVLAKGESGVSDEDGSGDGGAGQVQFVSLGAADQRVSEEVEADAAHAARSGAEAPSADSEKQQAGLAMSLRPQLRPEVLKKTAASGPVTSPDVMDAESVPVGTRLAQLGAFESAEIAEKEWGRLKDEFGEFLTNKQRVVQRAESGGRIFYRLRAMGFADLGDARRFCSALVAEDAECIPVVSR